MRIFLSHSSEHSEFVCLVKHYLDKCADHVYTYVKYQKNDQGFNQTIAEEKSNCDAMVVFIGHDFKQYQVEEVNSVYDRNVQAKQHNRTTPDELWTVPRFFNAFLLDGEGNVTEFPRNLVDDQVEKMGGRGEGHVYDPNDPADAANCAVNICRSFELEWRAKDDLPLDPHLFDYEKDVIDFYSYKFMLDELDASGQPGRKRDAALHRTALKLIGERPACFGHELQSLLTEENRRLGKIEDKKEKTAAFRKAAPRLVDLMRDAIRRKVLAGCPRSWPEVPDWRSDGAETKLNEVPNIGQCRPDGNRVVPAALSQYHDYSGGEGCLYGSCLARQNLCLLEAGPRERLYFPQNNESFNVAIVVSGGIAPGINAVIDGIVQRHRLYAKDRHEDSLRIYGMKNGFTAFDSWDDSAVRIDLDSPIDTSKHAHQGGSILGTSRVPDLIELRKRGGKLRNIEDQLRTHEIDILYVIGGDGSMKAAHAIWSTAHANLHDSNDLRERPLSVVAIPKTMDNDVLWVWQSFGFLSAVEKAREVIEQLHTEVTSNPRLCVLQLFGSDSGFVVSHAVLASGADRCDAALIPEVDFSLKGLAAFIKKGMVERRPLREGGARIPYGLIVMAETAIPVDALELIDIKDEDGNDVLGLTLAEKDVVRKYVRDRSEGKRIQGQTDDLLRNAGLKIVSRGLHHLIPQQGTPPGSGRVALQPDWKLFRVVTNEPRHLLRAIPPSCSDVIMGQRLGTLAVDNAMAGYTDFMISQWLTEYVLVPLKLVVLGRKRIPRSGIFWKSVAAKTEQPDPIL